MHFDFRREERRRRGQRLKILEETNDGFKIAEADLKLRGPGELLGREQSGVPKFRFGNLAEDLDLIRQARELVAKTFVASACGRRRTGSTLQIPF